MTRWRGTSAGVCYGSHHLYKIIENGKYDIADRGNFTMLNKKKAKRLLNANIECLSVPCCINSSEILFACKLWFSSWPGLGRKERQEVKQGVLTLISCDRESRI